MALAFCTRCGHRVSTIAPRCPGCGAPPYNLTRNNLGERGPREQSAVLEREPPAQVGKSLNLRIPISRSIVIAALAAIGAGWFFLYLPSTPSWALWQLYSDVRNNDGAAAAQLVDFQSVTKAVVDEAIAEDNAAGAKAGDTEGEEAGSEMLERGLVTLMIEPMSDAVKAKFEKSVDDQSKDHSRNGNLSAHLSLLAEALLNLRRQGSSAFTHLTDRDGKSVDVTMLRQGNGDWKVTRVGGASLRDAIDESMKEGRSDSAKRRAAQADIAQIKSGLDRFYLDAGSYPTTEQGLQALVAEPSGNVPHGWQGPYVERIPPDPWGKQYFYRSDGNSYILKSFGADGVEGGDGDNADIDGSSAS